MEYIVPRLYQKYTCSEWAWLYGSGYALKYIAPLFPIRVPGLFVPKTFHSQEGIVPMGTLVLETFRSRELSFPGNESSLELSFPGPFVLGNFRSRGTEVPGNFCSMDLSFRGTFVPRTFRSQELSFL